MQQTDKEPRRSVDNHDRWWGSGYRDRMRLVPRDGRYVEVYDNKTCAGCQALLVTPHVLISHRPCSCPAAKAAGLTGHRTLTCLGCDTVHVEPECVTRRS